MLTETGTKWPLWDQQFHDRHEQLAGLLNLSKIVLDTDEPATIAGRQRNRRRKADWIRSEYRLHRESIYATVQGSLWYSKLKDFRFLRSAKAIPEIRSFIERARSWKFIYTGGLYGYAGQGHWAFLRDVLAQQPPKGCQSRPIFERNSWPLPDHHLQEEGACILQELGCKPRANQFVDNHPNDWLARRIPIRQKFISERSKNGPNPKAGED